MEHDKKGTMVYQIAAWRHNNPDKKYRFMMQIVGLADDVKELTGEEMVMGLYDLHDLIRKTEADDGTV